MQYRPFPNRFRASFSFSGAQRKEIRVVATELEQQLGSGTVFFDEWFEHYIAGDDADLKLQDVYMRRSDLVIVCVSSSYDDRPWTRVEHQAIRALTMQLDRSSLRVLPLRFGEGEVEGVLVNAIVPDVRNRPTDEITALIVARINELSDVTARRDVTARQEVHVPAPILPVSEGPVAAQSGSVEPPEFDLDRFARLKHYAYSGDGLNLSHDGAIAWAEEKLAQEPLFDLERFRQLKKFAYSVDGLNLSHDGAIAWAEAKLAHGPLFDLERFAQLKHYAYSVDGLNLSHDGAIAWAEEKLAQEPPFDLERFRQLKKFAYSADGLNLSHDGAIAWAEERLRPRSRT